MATYHGNLNSRDESFSSESLTETVKLMDAARGTNSELITYQITHVVWVVFDSQHSMDSWLQCGNPMLPVGSVVLLETRPSSQCSAKFEQHVCSMPTGHKGMHANLAIGLYWNNGACN